MSGTPDCDVVVVGAGLAGLRCATRLADAGLETVVVEGGDAVGGRVRTDHVDGFLCDRGFQLLNPAYPAVRRWVDVDALGLQSFGAGVAVRRRSGLRVVADPRRSPTRLPRTLASGLVTPRETVALLRWLGPALARPRHALHGPDQTLTESLDAAGVRGPLRAEVLEPFLAGVLADASGRTSASFVQMLLRSFVLGTPGLPRVGMQALPEQLAAGLGDRVSLGERVHAVTDGADEVAVASEGRTRTARAVVVAVGPEEVATLTGTTAPTTNTLITWWFEAPTAPYSEALLTLDGRSPGSPSGPIQHAAVVSNAAPTYAPPGRHLVEATCLAGRGGTAAADEGAVRQHLAELWDHPTRDWGLLVRHEITHALPAQHAPLRLTAPARVGERVYAAGDHRDTASIQGALVSGDRVARAVIADLGAN